MKVIERLGLIAMSKKLKTIISPSTNTIVIERSEFITSLFPTDTAEDALEAIASVRKEHYNATHNCTAYVLGDPVLIQKTNDDGEPKGTAGMPMLQSLMHQNMTNVTAVVTRYYGGIKLGAGGLIRAYAGAVTDAILHAQLAVYEIVTLATITITYDELNAVYHLRDTTELFTIEDIVYDADITLTIKALSQNIAPIQEQLTSSLFRKIEITIIDENTEKFPL